MAETSAIEWTDSTFNPWIGCTKISPACDHCYAEALMDKRHHRVKWGGSRSRTKTWHQPVAWQREAAAFFAEHGRRRRVFCASLADVFDNQVPDDWRVDLWELIRATPDLDWQLLTKRPQNIGKMLPAFWDEVKSHVWLGTTVEDQKRANINVTHLLRHDAAVRFVSCEPLLERVDLTSIDIDGESEMDALGERATGPAHHTIDWVIAGGESGPQARPSHPDWIRSLRVQCAAAGVPFLFKQWGSWLPGNFAFDLDDHLHFEDLDQRSFPIGRKTDIHHFNADAAGRGDPEGLGAMRVGKATAGRLLDGFEHNGFPEVV